MRKDYVPYLHQFLLFLTLISSCNIYSLCHPFLISTFSKKKKKKPLNFRTEIKFQKNYNLSLISSEKNYFSSNY